MPEKLSVGLSIKRKGGGGDGTIGPDGGGACGEDGGVGASEASNGFGGGGFLVKKVKLQGSL